jgi:hypothetical protein
VNWYRRHKDILVAWGVIVLVLIALTRVVHADELNCYKMPWLCNKGFKEKR